jgi:hypothetical protein
MFRREEISWSWSSKRPEVKNDCAGDGQQQFNLPTDLNQVTACEKELRRISV